MSRVTLATSRTIAMVVLLVGSLASGGVGGVVAASGSGDATGAVQFGYVSSSTESVTLVTESGATIDTGVSAEVVGKGGDVDGDGYVEVPYVTDQQTLGVVDRTGEREQLADNAKKTKTKMAVGDLNGDGTPAVYYVRRTSSGNERLSRAYDNGTTEPVVSTDTAANAALGVADITGDGVPEIVFVGSSDGLKYYNETGDGVVKFYTSGIGSNSGLGVGAPRDFDGDGVARVPFVDGSNNALLAAPKGTDANVTTVVEGGVAKHTVAGVDWTDDSGVEFLYEAKGSANTVKWASLNGTTGTVTDASRNDIVTTNDGGVAWMPDAPLTVSNATLTNESGTLAFSVKANEKLQSIDAAVTGPNGSEHSVALDGFDATASDGTWWTYNATYAPDEDGNYTATVSGATSEGGIDWRGNQSDDATVVTRFNVTDLNATAAPDQRLGITFNATKELDSVTIDASGPSNATLGLSNFSTNESAPPYTYTGQYDANAGGNYTVTLTRATSEDGQVDDDELTANATLPIFEVDNATLNASGNRALRASFNATQSVADASISLDGPTNTTLDFADFTQTASEPYRYAETVNTTADGDYAFTVSDATSEGGIDWRGN
ncbi:FG-GAP-like repeat-containing protein, partial [Halarchaeum acidiphilum]